MGKLDGRVALVTGGSSGIGFATAQEFVGEGAYVFVTGRREKELATAVKEIGRNVTGIRADVSNSQDLDRLFSQIKNEKGKLDIVFANAGAAKYRSEEHTSELQSQSNLVCRLLLEKKTKVDCLDEILRHVARYLRVGFRLGDPPAAPCPSTMAVRLRRAAGCRAPSLVAPFLEAHHA